MDTRPFDKVSATPPVFSNVARSSFSQRGVQRFGNPTGENVQIGYLEYQGKGLDDLRADRDEIKGLMAVVGVQMIAGEKIAAEAPETLAIRRASENSALATRRLTLSQFTSWSWCSHEPHRR